MFNFKFLATCFVLLATSLFFYSYTQVDLNLTLSQFSLWQVIQKNFQYIGWFQRPLSTALYVAIIVLLFSCYLLLLRLIWQKKVNERQFWRLTIATAVILLFSYNAFSYDLFNYMFDARIVTYYHQDPYLHKALDYQGDPWINFMRWTHRTYPYGPVWLWLTVPLSFIGMQFFLPTLFLYKALMAASFLGTTYSIGKILEKADHPRKLQGMALFALNPLVVVESLVSAHNDIVMVFLALIAIQYILNRKYVRSFLLLIMSIGIKFSTIFLVPVYVAMGYFQLKRDISHEKFFWTALALMVVAVVLLILRTELQPWYLTLVLPFVALLSKHRLLVSLSLALSLGLLMHYVPFLYLGNYDPPVPAIRFLLTVLSIIVGILLYFLYNRWIWHFLRSTASK